MKRFRLSLRSKFTSLVLLGTWLPLTLAFAFSAIQQRRVLRRSFIAESLTAAALIASYSTADLAFRDEREASKTLSKLQKDESIELAGLYDADGRLFASYRQRDVAPRVDPRAADTVVEKRQNLDVYRAVADDGSRYGTLYIRFSAGRLQALTRAHLMALGLFAAAIALLPLAFFVLVQRIISRPVLQLARVASGIAQEGNYSVRVTKVSEDEIGLLSTAFNTMLSEVERRQREAEKAIEVRDEFLAIASHELYTPITSLKLSLQSLETAHGPADPQGWQFLGIATKQGARLERLVSELLDVTRLRRKVTLHLEQLDLVELVREVVARFAPEMARRGSALELTAEAAVVGRWDRSRLDQVVTNLLSNAVKFGRDRPIQVRVGPSEKGARLVVRDEGEGIPADRLAHIFEPYERAVSVRHYGGLGLGLHIVRSLVQAHGGRVEVQSELGRGSTFTVDLPLAPPEKEAGEQRDDPDSR
jgi:signal transduction histidine kinase